MTKPRKPEKDPNEPPPPDRVVKKDPDGNGSAGNTDDSKRGRGGSPYER